MQQCLDAGMDDFLAKPVRADALWAAVYRMVTAYPPQNIRGAELLDPLAVLRACGDNAATLEKICQTFRTIAPTQMERVRSALDDNNASQVREAAHVLYGTLAAFSTIAGAEASDLEDVAERGDLEASMPLVERLESMCGKLLEQICDLSIDKLRH